MSHRLARVVALSASLIAVPLAVAHAADMPLKAPPMAAAPSWTGFYLGANVGYGWAADPTITTGTTVAIAGTALASGTADLDASGILGGFEGGYNFQVGPNWLLGVEADYDLADINGSVSCLVCGAQTFVTYNSFSVTNKIEGLGTVRARLGMVTGPALLYVTGGLAYARVEQSASVSGTSNFGGAAFSGSYNNTSTRTGWTIGGGVELKLGGPFSAWSAKLEYLYADLGTVSDTLSEVYPTGGPFGIAAGTVSATRTVSTTLRDNIVRFGVDYQFSH